MGLYAARAKGGAGSARFRAWVHARPPDRLHLEVIAPVGGTVFVLDAGNGSVAAAWMEDRFAIEGRADGAECFEDVTPPSTPALGGHAADTLRVYRFVCP